MHAVGFWRGFITAILVLEWLSLGWLVRAAPAFEAMVADFNAVHVPWEFTLVTSSAYAVACLVGLVVAALLADRLPRAARARVLGLAAVAVVGGAVVGFTAYGLYSPIFAVAGSIR
jgi:hypothetical protein